MKTKNIECYYMKYYCVNTLVDDDDDDKDTRPTTIIVMDGG